MNTTARLPDFIIIGAMRAGTTTLWTYLNNHPEIYMAKKKEIGYFSDPKYKERELSWYTDMFSAAKHNQLCAEASTVYSRWPHYGNVAERIYNLCPDIKLIYVLRNPIERAHSHYAYKMQSNENSLTFDQALQDDSVYLDIGFYYEQIKQFLKFFNANQMHCILHEDLITNTEETLIDLQSFLGLSIKPLTKNKSYSINSRGDQILKKKLETRLNRIPGSNYLRKHIPTSLKQNVFKVVKGSILGSSTLKNYKPQELTDETREHLRKKFEKHNHELEKFIGRDLSHWV